MATVIGTVATLAASANTSVTPPSSKAWMITTLAAEGADEDVKFRLETASKNCAFGQGAHISQYKAGECKLFLSPDIFMEMDNTDGSNEREVGYSGVEI